MSSPPFYNYTEIPTNKLFLLDPDGGDEPVPTHWCLNFYSSITISSHTTSVFVVITTSDIIPIEYPPGSSI